MRVRLFLAFALVILVTLGGVAFFARQGTETQLHSFIGRGGWMGLDVEVAALEEFYRSHGAWVGVETLFNRPGRGDGQGKGQGGSRVTGINRLKLADLRGRLVYIPPGMKGASVLSEAELQTAILLTVDGRRVGYLIPPPENFAPGQDFEETLLTVINRASLNAAWISGALALLLALGAVSLLLKPLNQLTRAAERMAEGDLAQRVTTSGAQELVVLGEAFNHMAASLESAETRRREMTADIAHELRNPLAVQRAHLEALQDGVYPLTPENLEPVLRQSLLLTRLVEDLRTLALADSGELALVRRETQLAELAQDTLDQFKSHADLHSICLRCDLAPGCPPVMVDPERIQQILNNLLQNALRHAAGEPEGGEIRLGLRCDAGAAVLSVRDNGAGIPPEALGHIFERFYRADAARSREEGGTGLGLAIARRLAELHGGSLEAHNHSQGGAEFILRLPL